MGQMTQERKGPDPGMLERAARADAAGARPWVLAVSAAGFALIAILIGADAASDWSSGGGRSHLVVELVVMVLALGGTGALWGQLLSVRSRARLLARDLGEARADAARWKGEAQELLRGLGAAIDRQFERWKLSPAEGEVALLLLKGLSHKEVAELRQTSERTVRQQALALYRKAGLSGRAELAAFFLEDLLLPERRTSDRAP
jgi:DNA-binding CsgD family transcriptional regulator